MSSLQSRRAALRISPLGLVFLAVTSVGWGLNFPIMKNLLSEWPPLSSRGLCGVVGAVALALFAVARRQSLRVPRPMWSRLLLVSLLTIGGWVAFMGLALLWLNAGEAAVLGISIPVWVALLAWPILGERLSPLRAVSLAVALAGIAVLIGGHGIEASLAKLPGFLCVLAGAVMRRARHRADKAFSAGDAAAVAGGLADRHRLPADRDRRPRGRTAAARGAVIDRLGVDALYDADPVLPVLRLLVRSAGAIAGGDRLDRHAAGARDRRALRRPRYCTSRWAFAKSRHWW